MGAYAGIGGTYGTMLKLYLKMGAPTNPGKWAKAQMVQNLVTPLTHHLCSLTSMHGGAKGIISLNGFPMGNPSLQFLPMVLMLQNL